MKRTKNNRENGGGLKQLIKYKWDICLRTFMSYSMFLKKSVNEDKTEREIHDTYYSRLLFDYVENVKKTLRQKRLLKLIFFLTIMFVFLATFCLFWNSSTNALDIIRNAQKDKKSPVSMIAVYEATVIIVPALVSLIAAFLKIPEIIAKYLFNTEEDKYMTYIVKNLQIYDKDVLDIEYKIRNDAKGVKLTDPEEAWPIKGQSDPSSMALG